MERICLVCRDTLQPAQPLTTCPKCRVDYHIHPGRDCWGEMGSKCVNQICAWEGRICPVDQTAVHEGQRTYVCTSCATIYHSRCWDPAKGCLRMECGGDAPAVRPVGKPVVVSRLRALGQSLWPCGHVRQEGSSRCWECDPSKAERGNPGSGQSSPGCNGVGCAVGLFVGSLFVMDKFFSSVHPGGTGVAILAGVCIVIGILVAKRIGKVDAMRRAAAKPEPPREPAQADKFLQRCLDRLAQGDRMGAQADASAAISMRSNSCEAFLLRSLARYPADVQASHLDFAKARRMEPSTLEGYALLLSLDILYAHLSVVLALGNVGAQFRMPQTSLTLGAEAMLTKDLDLAERCFRSVLEFPSDAVLAALGLGLIQFWKGDEMETIRALRDLPLRDEHFQRFVGALRMGAAGDGKQPPAAPDKR